MTIQRAYKTKLVVNNREANYLRGCAGLARFVYNWGLAESKRVYEETGKTPSARNVLKKQFNAIKDEQYPWVRDYPYVVMQEAFECLDAAYKNFFRRVKNGETPGYPRFKKRSDTNQSFRLMGSIFVDEGRVKLPRIGWVRLAERGYLPANRDVNSATLSYKAGDWYISVQVEEEDPEPVTLHDCVLGVDRGVKVLAALSDGTLYENPKIFRTQEKKLARLQRELSRRKKGGENWKKTKAKIGRLHHDITNTRRHVQHDISADITKNKRPAVVVLEELNTKGLMKRAKPKQDEAGNFVKNGRAAKSGLTKSIGDAGWSELQRQIEYKGGWLGIQVETVPAHYTSRTCSRCGTQRDMKLSDRVFECPSCGLVIDRDINAAINIAARIEPVRHGGLPVELDG